MELVSDEIIYSFYNRFAVVLVASVLSNVPFLVTVTSGLWKNALSKTLTTLVLPSAVPNTVLLCVCLLVLLGVYILLLDV